MAAEKSPYFAINPAVGGNPAKETIKIAKAPDSKGFCDARPRNCLKVKLCSSFSAKDIMAKAPRFIAE